VTLGVAIATTWCGVSLLGAQTTGERKDSQVWGLQGLRAGYCVRFLLEPRLASRQLRDGFRLLRADQDSTIHPAIRRMIQTQPEFASWAPSSVCFYFTDAVQVGRRRVVEKDARRYQMIAAWILGTQEPKTGGRRDIVVDMYASRSTLRRAAEAARVRLEDAHSVVADRADTTFDIYNVKLERTVLAWHGRPTGDSTRVERPIQESWSVPGLRAGAWTARLAMSPMWSRPLVGSLTVQGKGDLAKALKASPIRFVGPLYRGGGGELRLSR